MQQNYPKISIITPTFNQVAYIEKTILSVLNQNYPNLEYIIIDAGSDDGTLDVIKKYESKLSYWVSERDNGLYDAIYKGFEIATGEILAWLNSDDIFIDNSLFTVSEIFKSFSEVNWLQGANSHCDERNRIVSVYPSKYWTFFDFYIGCKLNIQQESTFFRAKLWKDSGKQLNRHSQLAGDYGLWLSFINMADLYIVSAPLGCFRMRSSNQKSLDNKNEYLVERKNIYKSQKKMRAPASIIYLYKLLDLTLFFYFLKCIKLEIKFKRFFFKGPQIIVFNRINQKFELHQ